MQYNLTQVVFDESRIRALAQAGRKLGQNAQVHLKLDTGMNRIGVRTEEEAQALTRLIDSLSGIELTGCFTHMATADEDDPTGTLKQIAKFDVLCRAIKAVHPAESSATARIRRASSAIRSCTRTWCAADWRFTAIRPCRKRRICSPRCAG